MQENVLFPSPQTSAPTVETETVSASTSAVLASSSASEIRVLRWPLVLGGVVALATCGGFAASGAYSNWASSSQIAPGVSVAGVALGGLTPEQARTRIHRHFGDLPLTLKIGERGFKVSLAALGGQPAIGSTTQKAAKIGRESHVFSNLWRVYGARGGEEHLALPIRWNKVMLVAKLRQLDKKYATKAIDARLEVDENGVQIRPAVPGRELNLGATAKQIQEKYFVGTPAIQAFTRQTAPQIAATDLEGRDVLLGAYPTRFNPGLEGRTANIRVACAAIEGKILMPGETFSFNTMTGERTFDKGYRMAHIFETKPGQTEAEVVDGLAGGVCQVSSTLFNAVRRTNQKADARRLKIVERNTHSLPVTYVPSGLDATVAWPGKDFRFRNNFSHPIYLRTTLARSKLTIGIWGRIPDVGLASQETN